MPRANSEQFGELEYSEESLIRFPRGLPGFEQSRRFVLIDHPEHAPLIHLQSLENATLCFVAIPIRCIDPAYELQLSKEEQDLISPTDPLLILTLLAATEDGQITANLLAPIVIHLPTRVAVQSVRSDTKYSYQQAVTEVKPCS
jgi:flagellar assembly factor FliW